MTLYRAWEENDRLYMQMELCKSNLQTFAMEMKWIPEAMVWSILLDLLLVRIQLLRYDKYESNMIIYIFLILGPKRNA